MRMELSLGVDSLGIFFGFLNGCAGFVLFALASHRAFVNSNTLRGFVWPHHPRVFKLLPLLVVVFLPALDSACKEIEPPALKAEAFDPYLQLVLLFRVLI